MSKIEEWRSLLAETERDLAQLESEWLFRKERVDSVLKEFEELTKEVGIISETESLLHVISTQILGESTSTIDKLVTAGLQLVFEDQNLTLETEMLPSRGKTAIRFKLAENNETAPIKDSYGGGVLALVGVLLRVTTILVLDLKRFLVLDESLSHVAAQYVHPTSKFLKKLCEDLGFEIVMVTHQPEFAEYADKHYEAKRVRGKTVIEEKNGR